jgi:hypothetical protein
MDIEIRVQRIDAPTRHYQLQLIAGGDLVSVMP